MILLAVILGGIWYGVVRDDYTRGMYYFAFAMVSLLIDLVTRRPRDDA